MSDEVGSIVVRMVVTVAVAVASFGLGLALHALTLGRDRDGAVEKKYATTWGSAALCLGVVGAVIAADLSLRGWRGWWPVAVADRLPQYTLTALLAVVVAGIGERRGVPLVAIVARSVASLAIVGWITVTARERYWGTGESVAWVGGLTIAMVALWTLASAAGRGMRGGLAALSLALLAGGSSGAVYLGSMAVTAIALGAVGIAMLALAVVTFFLKEFGRSPSALGVGVVAMLAAWGCAWRYGDLAGWALLILATAPLGLGVYPLLGRFTKWKAWLRGLAQIVVIALVLGGAVWAQYAAQASERSEQGEEYVW